MRQQLRCESAGGNVLFAVQFRVHRAGNVLGEVAPVLDLDPRVSVLMQHQRGGADGVQHRAHVDRLVHLIQCRA